MKPRLLILTAYFPPKNHIASSRMFAFAKYLSSDFDVTVITHSVDNKPLDGKNNFDVIYFDNGFLDSLLVLKNTDGYFQRKIKLVIRKLFNILGLSFYLKWNLKAKREFEKQIYNSKPKFILTSYMPIDTHDMCFDVLNSDFNLNDIFWIADMRDEMSEHASNNIKQKDKLRNKEKIYSKRIDLVTSVSLPILNQFERNMPEVKNFLEIRNGFDHALEANYKKNKKLTIGYFGTFYGDIKPDNFFSALLKTNFLNEVEVYIASGSHNYNIPEKLKNSIKQIDFLTYEKSVTMMAKMDCNLLILPFKGARKGVYSGKLFDYLSTTRPILGLIDTNDVAANLIRDFDCDYLADPYDIDEIHNMLYTLYNDWKESKLKVANVEAVSKLHRNEQVNILKKFLLEQNTKDDLG